MRGQQEREGRRENNGEGTESSLQICMCVCVRNRGGERDESQEEMVKERNRDLVVVREQEVIIRG